MVPEAKACRSWHGYELGPRESRIRSGNKGIYFERLVQAMEGEREKTQGPQKKETRKRSQKQVKQNAAKKRKEKEERQLSTQGPQKKRKEKEEKQLNSKRRKKKGMKKEKKKNASGK